MRNKVLLIWISAKHEWHLIELNKGRTIQELFDCENIYKFFKDPRKDMPNYYLIQTTTTSISKEGDDLHG